MTEAVSFGKCGFCRKTFNRSSISSHLQTCQKRTETLEKGSKGGGATPFFELFAEGREAPWYWMAVAAQASCRLSDLDDFLRREWLECCGHLSAFKIGKSTYLSQEDCVEEPGEEDMDFTLSEVLSPGMKFSYEYDFGSTTELYLKVVSEFNAMQGRSRRPKLLARNDAPLFSCECCGKKASWVCAFCNEEGEGSEKGRVCGECQKKHECGEEALLPIVNSPRTGTYGYTGQSS